MLQARLEAVICLAQIVESDEESETGDIDIREIALGECAETRRHRGQSQQCFGDCGDVDRMIDKTEPPEPGFCPGPSCFLQFCHCVDLWRHRRISARSVPRFCKLEMRED